MRNIKILGILVFKKQTSRCVKTFLLLIVVVVFLSLSLQQQEAKYNSVRAECLFDINDVTFIYMVQRKSLICRPFLKWAHLIRVDISMLQ